jgi:oligopeptide transport system substrate-binding protein
MTKKMSWFRLAIMILLVLTCACSMKDPDADFAFINGAEPETLDPAIMTGDPESKIAMAIYEGLTTYDPMDLSPVPGVAESWEISPDRKNYTFHLRRCRWSDGSPITAQDFVYSWERTLNPETASDYAYQLWYIKNAEKYSNTDLLEPGDKIYVIPEKEDTIFGILKDRGKGTEWVELETGQKITNPKKISLRFNEVGIKALDSETFAVVLENPTPYFLDLTSFFTLLPVNSACVTKYGEEWIKPGRIITNGPFILAGWKLNRYIYLKKNPFYWDADNVGFETILALPIESACTGFNIYATGMVNWIDSGAMPLPLMDILMQRKDFHKCSYLASYFIRCNVKRKPFDDPRVRKAFNLSIDKERITKFITKAGQIPATALVPPGIPGYVGPAGLAYDPMLARELLADAGFPGGRGFPNVEYLYNSSETHKDIAEVLQSMWKQELNIEVELSNQEWKVYLNSTNKLEYDLARSAWIGDYTDPNTFLDMFVTNGGNNRTGWSNAVYDSLIARAAEEPVPEQRMEILREAEKLLVEDELPILPLYYYVSLNMYDDWVQGIYPNIRNIHPLKYLSSARKGKS